MPKNGANGTSYFTNYKMNVEAVIALSDDDFYMFMSKIESYVNVWVNTNCPKIIRAECERLQQEFWDKQNQPAA